MDSFTGSHEELEVKFNQQLEVETGQLREKYEEDIRRLQDSHDEEVTTAASAAFAFL